MADDAKRASLLAALKAEVGGRNGLWDDALHLLHFPVTLHPGGGWSIWRTTNGTGTVMVDACYTCAECPGPLCEHAAAAMIYDRSQEKSMPNEAVTVLPPSIDIAAWEERQAIVDTFIQKHFQEGSDYHIMKGKPSLGKAGAEKLATLFHLRPTFTEDARTREMMGNEPGLLCYICVLYTQKGQIFAEGRGARRLNADPGDPNKTVKMVEKSAMIDATLRGFSLSGRYTQDMEDQPGEEQALSQAKAAPQMTPTAPAKPQPPTPPAYGPQVAFVASELRQSDHNNRLYWNVFGEDIPPRFAKYGISLSPKVARECLVDIDEPPTDISGWVVEWSTREYQGKTYANVDRLIDPNAGTAVDSEDDDDSDIPF